MIHFERLKAPWNSNLVFVDHNLFEILPNTADSSLAICAQLNCTFFGIAREQWGRTNLGQGSLKTEGTDIQRFRIADPTTLGTTDRDRLESVFAAFASRPITQSVYEELGAFTPEEVALDKVKPDRRALDQIVMGDILGLTDEEHLEVYRAVIDLVKSRIEKAKTFDKKKRVGGIDVESLKQTIIDRIDREEEE